MADDAAPAPFAPPVWVGPDGTPLTCREKIKVLNENLEEIRDMQRTVADETKVAFWDTLAAMGGAGAIARWDAAKVMNKDLVHPKKRAADLLGDLFARALLAL